MHTMNDEPRELELQHLIDSIVDAIAAKDIGRLRALYAPDIVSFDVEPPLQHAGIEAKLRNWERVFQVFGTVAYEVRDLMFEVSDELAFGRGFGRLSGTRGTGGPGSGTPVKGMWVRATFCFRRVDGAWLVVHDHVSVPLVVETGKGVIDLEP
jgi:ketosteroid isomerase-like protein